MIVVEGPDGAGKSTLCKQLCDHFRLEMGERGTTNRDEIFKCTREDTWRAVHSELSLKGPLVWDRLGPWSDPIYSKHAIPSRDCAFSLGELGFMRNFCRHFQIPVIICLPEFPLVKENVEKEHQMAGVVDRIDRIYHDYQSMLLYSQYLPFIHYNYMEPNSLKNVISRVQGFMGYRREREIVACS